MNRRSLEAMTREELIRELTKLEEAGRRFGEAGATDVTRLVHDLTTHEVELEMQNRELREAQAVIEESRARYARLYDFAPVGYCTLDPSSRIREINLTGARLLGESREALVGRPLLNGVPTEQRANFVAHVQACERSTTQVTTELELSTKHRGPVVVQLVSSAERDRSGAMVGLNSALVDVSDARALEDRLRFLDSFGEALATSLDTSSTAAAVVRLAVPQLADVCILDMVNGAGQLKRVDVASADSRHQVHLEQLKAMAPASGDASAQGAVVASRRPMLRGVLSGALTGARLDASGKVMRALGARAFMILPLLARNTVIGAITFITTAPHRDYREVDLELAEDFARRAALALDNARLHEQAKREWHNREAFLAAVSHDLRTPLGVIMTTAATILVNGEHETKIVPRIEAIQRAANRMLRMIEDLLDAASIEAGKFAVIKARVAADELVRDVVESTASQAAAMSARIVCQPFSSFDVSCDRERILQVLANLVGNAIKFGPRGGVVVLRAETYGGEGRFCVTDEGPGISADDLERVFDRFWQATRLGQVGSGLGLSIARGIVQAHGGGLWAESVVGSGSTFTFTLPLASESSVEPSVEGPVRHPDTVLLVEEDDDVRHTITEALEERGMRVDVVPNGAGALAYLDTGAQPALIVLDVRRAVGEARAFLSARVRAAALRRIPLVVVGEPHDFDDRVRGAQVQACVPVPLDPRALGEQVAALVH